MSALAERPVCILVAALGGEGGGVLADWLVDAASHEGFPVQSTSIPGVSQRTGATTYYVEIFPARAAELGGRQPVLALTPCPGSVDLMAASELVEAGRAMQNGYVSPQRTTLVASTHRVYATAEKIVPGDGRYEADAVAQAAGRIAARALLFDMAALAQASGSVINAVLFGAMAASGALPLAREACEGAIRRAGKGGEASLAGFAAGWARAVDGREPAVAPAPAAVPPALPPRLAQRVTNDFPAALRATLEIALPRLLDYQDIAYAALYLDRLHAVCAAEGAQGVCAVGVETARRLAAWMCYEDLIRVAQLKTRAGRYARVRSELGAQAGEPVRIYDYFKPGRAELADLLTPGMMRRLGAPAPAARKKVRGGWQLPSSSVLGFLALRLVAALRPWRRRSARYAAEQALIGRWLAAVESLARANPAAALEAARCAELIKGYSDTHQRGQRNFERVLAGLVETGAADGALAARIRQAREAALADAGGRALDASLAGGGASAGAAVQKLVFMPRPTRRGAAKKPASHIPG